MVPMSILKNFKKSELLSKLIIKGQIKEWHTWWIITLYQYYHILYERNSKSDGDIFLAYDC